MPAQNSREEILALINKYKTVPLKKLNGIPASYAVLEDACVTNELVSEVAKLNQLFQQRNLTIDQIRLAFKALCQYRCRHNQSTALSFSAMPEGDCNKLYWRIAELLFAPRNLREMIAILLPDIKHTWKIDYAAIPSASAASRKLVDRVQVTLKKSALSELSESHCDTLTDAQNPVSRLKSGLSECIIIDDAILPVEEIKRLPLAIQINLYKHLDNHPARKQKVYAHNDDLKQLCFDLEWLSENGKTPNEAINQLIAALNRSGSKYTGQEFASNVGIVAGTQFRAYLDRLPEACRIKIENLRTESGHTLAWVMQQLSLGECVEITAERFISIQAANKNQAILHTAPILSATERNKLEKKYATKELQQSGKDIATSLPDYLKQRVFPTVNITTVGDYVDMLINLPIEAYNDLLHLANIKNSLLNITLIRAMQMFTLEQKNAFMLALINNAKRFGEHDVLMFCIACGDITICKKALTLFPAKKHLKILKKKDYYLNTALHMVAMNPNIAVAKMFMTDYFNNTPYKHLSARNSIGNQPLNNAAKNSNPEVLSLLMNAITPAQRITLTNKRNRYGSTLLHYAAINPNAEAIRFVLAVYPADQRTNALNKRTYTDESALFSAARNSNPDVLRILLLQYSDEERLKAIKQRNKNGDTITMIAIYNTNPNVLQRLKRIYFFTLEMCAFQKIYHELYKRKTGFKIDFLAEFAGLSSNDIRQKITACLAANNPLVTPLVNQAWELTHKHVKFGLYDSLDNVYKSAMLDYHSTHRQTSAIIRLATAIPRLFSSGQPQPVINLENGARARPVSLNLNN